MSSLSDIGRLRTLVLVLDLGSVSAAATVLGYTQSAVSQQLAALERETGATLVDRSRRPFRATLAGAALRQHAEHILAEVQRAGDALDDLRTGNRRRLRLAAFPSALSSFVAIAVRDLRRSDADLVIEVHQNETRESIEELRRGTADLAVIHHMPGISSPALEGLERRPLLTDELRVVLPVRHRLAARKEVRLADLAGEPLLVPRRDTPAGRFRSLVDRLCAEAGFSPRIAYEVDDLVAAQAFAAAGIAVVLMHGLTVIPPVPGVAVRQLAEAAAGARVVEAVLLEGPRDPAVDRLLEHLIAQAGARRRT